MPAEGRENPLLKKGNSDAFFREKYLTKNTGLEGDDASVGLREIELGKMPNMYPFAILEVMYGNEEIEEAVQLKGERMGWLLRRHLVFSSE